MNKRMAALALVVTVGGCSQPAPKSEANASPAAASGGAATAVSPADMKGTWVGTSQSIVKGKTRHHAPAGESPPLLDNVQFTYVIEGQDGNRFWGKLSSPLGEESLTGVVGLDGQTVVARTSEGEIRGTLTDADTIQLVYSAGGPSTVLAVNTMKRQK